MRIIFSFIQKAYFISWFTRFGAFGDSEDEGKLVANCRSDIRYAAAPGRSSDLSFITFRP